MFQCETLRLLQYWKKTEEGTRPGFSTRTKFSNRLHRVPMLNQDNNACGVFRQWSFLPISDADVL